MIASTIVTSNLVLAILLNLLTCTRLATPAFKPEPCKTQLKPALALPGPRIRVSTGRAQYRRAGLDRHRQALRYPAALRLPCEPGLARAGPGITRWAKYSPRGPSTAQRAEDYPEGPAKPNGPAKTPVGPSKHGGPSASTPGLSLHSALCTVVTTAESA